MAVVENNLRANVGDLRHVGFISESGRSPGGGHGNPLQYPCLEKPRGQRSLVGYSPEGRKELDMTEWPSTAQSIPKVVNNSYFLEFALFTSILKDMTNDQETEVLQLT